MAEYRIDVTRDMEIAWADLMAILDDPPCYILVDTNTGKMIGHPVVIKD